MKKAVEHDLPKKERSAGRISLFGDMAITECGIVFEEQCRSEGFRYIAGIDEVGRGCLAGPVVAAACILDPAKPLPKGLNDSKKVAAERRAEIAAELKISASAFAVGIVDAGEIDRINILEATKSAMLAAIAGLQPAADYLLIDALQLKASPLPQKAIIKGDSISASIAAASIIAKTFRDEMMRELAETFPEYGFAENAGYGTAAHLRALREHGPCRLHRMTFRGVLPADGEIPARDKMFE